MKMQVLTRDPLKGRGLGAWHPPLFAANKGACLRTAPIASPGASCSIYSEKLENVDVTLALANEDWFAPREVDHR